METCAAGCVSCCSPEHIPSFGDGEQLCLLKCKFPLGAAAAAAAATAAGKPRLGCSGEEGEAGGGERCTRYRQDLSSTMQRLWLYMFRWPGPSDGFQAQRKGSSDVIYFIILLTVCRHVAHVCACF